MDIYFTKHSEEKFNILKLQDFPIKRSFIVKTLETPDKVEKGYGNTKIAQKELDEDHILRVVFKKESDKITVITFYPGRKDRYL